MSARRRGNVGIKNSKFVAGMQKVWNDDWMDCSKRQYSHKIIGKIQKFSKKSCWWIFEKRQKCGCSL